MDTIAIILASLLFGAVITIIATKLGAFKDTDKDAIPDKVEEKLAEFQKKVEKIIGKL
jgi:hypothetical protein